MVLSYLLTSMAARPSAETTRLAERKEWYIHYTPMACGILWLRMKYNAIQYKAV